MRFTIILLLNTTRCLAEKPISKLAKRFTNIFFVVLFSLRLKRKCKTFVCNWKE